MSVILTHKYTVEVCMGVNEARNEEKTLNFDHEQSG